MRPFTRASPLVGGHTRENLQQSAFTRAIAANDTEDFALLDLKGNSAQRPHLVVAQIAVRLSVRTLYFRLSTFGFCSFIHLGMRVGFPANAMPPSLKIVTERACANDPQAVLLPDVVNFNDSAH